MALRVNNLIGFGVRKRRGVALVINSLGVYTSGGNSTTYTSTAHSLGSAPAAGKRRFIVVAAMANNGSAGTLSSMSVGGVNMPLAVSTSHLNLGDNVAGGIGWLEVAAGTTADIAVTFSGNQGGCLFQVWNFICDEGYTMVARDTDSVTAAVDTTVTSENGDAAFAMMASRDSGSSPTLAAGSYTAETPQSGSNTSYLGSAKCQSTGGDLTADWTQGTPNAQLGLAACFGYE